MLAINIKNRQDLRLGSCMNFSTCYQFSRNYQLIAHAMVSACLTILNLLYQISSQKSSLRHIYFGITQALLVRPTSTYFSASGVFYTPWLWTTAVCFQGEVFNLITEDLQDNATMGWCYFCLYVCKDKLLTYTVLFSNISLL